MASKFETERALFPGHSLQPVSCSVFSLVGAISQMEIEYEYGYAWPLPLVGKI